MIAVLFEVEPKPQHKGTYLDIAAGLAEALNSIDGVVSVERFTSLANPEKLLSLSFWESEEAIANWRNHPEHRSAQWRGQTELFTNYRIRVASVVREYDLTSRHKTIKSKD